MKINSYLLIALLLAVSILLIIFIPRWQEENYRSTINSEDIARLEPKDRVQLQKDLALVENSFRTTLAQVVGGSLLLLSLLPYLSQR
jgi:amino acid permease